MQLYKGRVCLAPNLRAQSITVGKSSAYGTLPAHIWMGRKGEKGALGAYTAFSPFILVQSRAPAQGMLSSVDGSSSSPL